MRLACFFLVVLFFSNASGQKPPIDANACKNWPTIYGEQISANGQFVAYGIILGAGRSPRLVVKNLKDGQRLEFPGVSTASFTNDGRRIAFLQGADSLHLLELENNRDEVMPGVGNFVLPGGDKGGWLYIELKRGGGLLMDLYTGKKLDFPKAKEGWFDGGGMYLWLKESLDSGLISIVLVDLKDGSKKEIWRGITADGFTFGQSGKRLAFRSMDKDGARTIWYKADGEEKARVLLGDTSACMEMGFNIGDGNLDISPDGKRVFFSLRRRKDPISGPTKEANVKIWGYNDEFLPVETGIMRKDGPYRAVFIIGGNRMFRLRTDSDAAWGNLNQGGGDDYFVTESLRNGEEAQLYKGERSEVYLVSTKDGSRTCIVKGVDFQSVAFSPGGKYCYWYNKEKRVYIVYDIGAKRARVVSAGISTLVYGRVVNMPALPENYGVAGWLGADSAMLVYDQYDVWSVDPTGEKSPSLLTNGYGRKHHIVLRAVYSGQDGLGDKQLVFLRDTLLLCALNEKTKENGFFAKELGGMGDPVQLCMSEGDYYFSDHTSHAFASGLFKARHADIYLLRYMTARRYRNLVISRDFSSFDSVSDLQPEVNYRWLKSEIFHWKTFAGHDGVAALYKPEDFDGSRKYPVIFLVYERLSDALNVFPTPETAIGSINIAWMVSHGYVVCCPDIQYEIGKPGSSAYDYVVSAAKAITALAWVDPKRMGIDGHSYGGYEVNYIVTHSKVFAAAVSGAGISDLISDYDALAGNWVNQAMVEKFQERMGRTPWEDPAGYIRESPVFAADHVRTPLLMMHNRGDVSVPWQQGIEMFLALRRLDKQVWLLEYGNSGHMVMGENNALDYTARLSEFFDYYLKNGEKPQWMKEEGLTR